MERKVEISLFINLGFGQLRVKAENHNVFLIDTTVDLVCWVIFATVEFRESSFSFWIVNLQTQIVRTVLCCIFVFHCVHWCFYAPEYFSMRL